MLRPGGKALDLGTDYGMLALVTATCAGSAIGTDINQRALAFCEINAALNGVSNVTFYAGRSFRTGCRA